MVVIMCVVGDVCVMVGNIGYLTCFVNGIINPTDRTTPCASHTHRIRQ